MVIVFRYFLTYAISVDNVHIRHRFHYLEIVYDKVQINPMFHTLLDFRS